MKLKVLVEERGLDGIKVGSRFKTIAEYDENIAVSLSRIDFSQIDGIWCLEITRNSTPWLKVYLSDNQLRKLQRKMEKHDIRSIVCPSKGPVSYPFGIPADVYLNCTDEGLLEIVKTPEYHRFILGFDFEQLCECENQWFHQRACERIEKSSQLFKKECE